MTTDVVQTIGQFYEQNAQALFTYALTLTRDRASAEDVVHDVICRVLTLGALPGELRPYIFRCVRNAAVDEWRRNQRRDDGPLESAESVNGGFERALVAQLQEFLYCLSGDELETVVLRIFDDLTLREIAVVKQVSVNTVASWYRRGLARLREMVEGGESCETSKSS